MRPSAKPLGYIILCEESPRMTYKISKKRREFIESHFFEWSFGKPDDYVPSKKDFLELSHPAELHYLAYIYNWDDDAIVLRWILESPLCSRATANLLFWRSLPSYFEDSDFDDESTCPEYCEAGFSLVKMVLEKYKRNAFSDIDIAFDPKGETETLRNDNPTWKVPPGVFDKLDGINIDVEE